MDTDDELYLTFSIQQLTVMRTFIVILLHIHQKQLNIEGNHQLKLRITKSMKELKLSAIQALISSVKFRNDYVRRKGVNEGRDNCRK